MGTTWNEHQPLIRVRNLKKYFKINSKLTLHAVDDVSFDIYPGEALGLVGESGCGKSTVGNVIMRLLPKTSGEVYYRGKNIFSASTKQGIELRKKMQIIFQDPFSSLNPQKNIFSILSEAYRIHGISDAKELQKKIEGICNKVGISTDLLGYFPHELDGGMRQIVGIARALSLSPDFIVCDEPLSALDVSIQAKIINLLMDLQKEMNLAYLFISHDLSVVRHISNRIAVMYLGQIVELAETEDLFNNTMHPYSIALLSAIPVIDMDHSVDRIVLQGDVPSPLNPKPGCRFAPRCWMAKPECSKEMPLLREVESGHFVACNYAECSHHEKEKATTSRLRKNSAADTSQWL